MSVAAEAIPAGGPRGLVALEDRGASVRLARCLEDLGAAVRLEEGGVLSLESRDLDATAFVVLGLDPGGLACCRALRAQAGPMLPILLCREEALEPGLAEAAREAGATELLAAPFAGAEARLRLGVLLALARLRAVLASGGDSDAFEAALQMEWRRAERTQRPLALLLVAAEGPSVTGPELEALEARLEGLLARTGDRVNRMEATHFACLLPDTDVPGALGLFERIRREVALPAGWSLRGGFAAAFASQLLDPSELLFRARHGLGLAPAGEARGGRAG